MGKGSLLERLGLKRTPPLSLGEFRDAVVAEVLRRTPEFALQLVHEAEISHGKNRVTTVERGYEYYREHPRERDLVVGQLADLILFESPPAREEDLIVLVRPATFQAGGEGKDDRGLARPLAGDLIAVVACDTPDRFVFSTARELRDALGMDDEALWDRALDNTRRRTEITPRLPREGAVAQIEAAGLAASLVADGALWDDAKLTARGPVVVAPIERDLLLFAPYHDAASMRAFRDWMASYRRTSQWLCDLVLLRRDGAWEVLGEGPEGFAPPGFKH